MNTGTPVILQILVIHSHCHVTLDNFRFLLILAIIILKGERIVSSPLDTYILYSPGIRLQMIIMNMRSMEEEEEEEEEISLAAFRADQK